MLSVHLVLGYAVVLCALGALFIRSARRVVLYVLALQIVAGAIVWYQTKLVPPPAHWIMAILTGGLYSAAAAFERRGRSKGLITGVLALAAGVIAYIFYLGMHAAGTNSFSPM